MSDPGESTVLPHWRLVLAHGVLWLLAASLGMITGVLSAAPLKMLYLRGSRATFMIGLVFVTLTLWTLGLQVQAAGFLATGGVIFIAAWIQGLGFSVFMTFVLSVSLVLGIGATGLAAYLVSSSLSLQKWLETVVGAPLADAARVLPEIQVDPTAIYQQVPSILFILGLFSLAIGNYVASRWALDRLETEVLQPPPSEASSTEVSEDSLRRRRSLVHVATAGPMAFIVPAWVVWVLMVALLGAYTSHPWFFVRVGSLNFVNIVVAIYGLQGIAVASTFMVVHGVGAAWRFLAITFLVINLLPLLAILGLADFWIDFRRRIFSKFAKIQH